MFTIEKNVPLPLGKNPASNGLHAVVKSMEIGDSFLIPDVAKVMVARSRLQRAVVNTGFKVLCRIEGSGVRVWRVA